MSGVVQLLLPQTLQPQLPVGIDNGNALTIGILGAWIGGRRAEIARKSSIFSAVAGVTGTLTIKGTRAGLGWDTSSGSVAIGGGAGPFAAQVSVVAIVQLDSAGSFPMAFSAATSGADGNEGFELRCFSNAGTPNFSVDESTGRPQATATTSIVGVGPVVIAGTYDGAAVRVYGINGETASAAGSGNIAGIGTNWQIGDRATTGLSWPGKIVLAAVWNRALSAGEVRALQANPWQIFEPESVPVYFPDAAGGFIPYPRPRGYRAGMLSMSGGMQ